MYPTKPQILMGLTNQVFTFEAPQGRPSSDGLAIVNDPRFADDHPSHTIQEATAARKSIETTVTGNSGPGQTSNKNRVVCTPPSGLAVGDFVILNSLINARSERIEVMEKATGYIAARYNLGHDYVNNDTIKSAVMSFTFNPDIAGWLDDENNLGVDLDVVWVYVISGTTYIEHTRWDFVREIVNTECRDSDLYELAPDLARHKFASQPEGFLRQIRGGQKVVDMAIRSMQLEPSLFRGTEIVKYLVALATLWLIMEHPTSGYVQAQAERAQARYEAEAARLLLVLRQPYDKNNDGVNQKNEASHQVRLRRR